MANFNTTRKTNPMDAVNHEGAQAHSLSAMEKLFSKALGSFFGEKTFYEDRSANSALNELKATIAALPEKDLEYAFKIAALARYSGMIQYPLHILAAALMDSRMHKETDFQVYPYAKEVILRAQDMNDILAAYFASGYKASTLPAKLRKALKKRFESFDQFKLSKGLNKGSSVSLADTIKVIHPTPKNAEMASFYKDILENRITSGNGKAQLQAVKTAKGAGSATDEDIVKSLDNTSMIALVKNLNNLYKDGMLVGETLEKVITRLSSTEDVAKSKILPYRFYQAYLALGNTYSVEGKRLQQALSDALDASIASADAIDGYNVYLVDVSASMRDSLSDKSTMTRRELAVLLGVTAYKRGVGDLVVFSDSASILNAPKTTPAVVLIEMALHAINSSGTDLCGALTAISTYAKKNNIKYDNLIMISDGDCYGYDRSRNSFDLSRSSYWYRSGNSDDQLNKMFSEGTLQKFWLNDVSGNDTTVANTNSYKKNLIIGFTERFINMINMYNSLGTGKDLRKVIDMALEQERQRYTKKS